MDWPDGYIYTYSSLGSGQVPYEGYWGVDTQIPVEQTVQYYDTSGSLLRTVTKGWFDAYDLACELDTLDNGQIAGKFYNYGSGGVVTDAKEYDYGQLTSTSSCTNGATAPSSPTPARETVTTYQGFAATPIYPSGPSILDRPSSVVVKDSNGNRAAETDYTYDQTSVLCAGSPNCVTAAAHDEANYGTNSATPRGNATTIKKQCFVGSTTCTNSVTTLTYDETGQVFSMNDPCGNASCTDMPSGSNHTTRYSYADVYSSCAGAAPPSGATNAYLTAVTNPLGQIQSFCYGYDDGQLRGSTDPNSQTTTYIYNTKPVGCGFQDKLDRLGEIDYPDGGKTYYCYDDASYNPSTSPPSPSVTTTRPATPSPTQSALTAFDGLGHTVRQVHSSSCVNGDQVDTTYDGLGRGYTVSNPYCTTGDLTYGLTTYTYDALGRTTKVIPPDGSASSDNVSTSYSGNCTTVTDEASKSRKSCSDGLGRMTGVWEDPAVSKFETDYQYDALNNLLCVAQKGTNSGTFTNCPSTPASWRPRTFTYDSLSRLLCASNPENSSAPCPTTATSTYTPGTTGYGYDANGNLATKTALAPNQTGTATVTTNYTYEPLNRLTQKSYSDGTTPYAQYTYDASTDGGPIPNVNTTGRLAVTWSPNDTGSKYNYDPMGRVANSLDCIDVNCNWNSDFSYTYDLVGNLKTYTNKIAQWTNPPVSSITFNQSFDSAGRVTQLTSSLVDAQHPATLVTVDPSIGYFPHGALRKASLGNGLALTNVYNNRLQPCFIDVNQSNATLQTCNDNTPAGNILDFWMTYDAGTADNGNVTYWAASSGYQSFARTYGYDPLNRLFTLSQTSGIVTGCSSVFSLSWNYDAWGNRWDQNVTGGTCYPFHASVNTKNQLVDTVNNKYQYDAAGNMIQDASHTYTYDAENRVIKVDGGATASYAYDPNGRRVQKTIGATTTSYVYDLAGNTFLETQGSSWVTTYIYFAGRLQAQYKNGINGITSFIHGDHLGSTRFVTAMNQSVSDNLDYLPFGEQISGDTATTHKFTGKERDSESGLDNFGARYYANTMGRFMSPDWSASPEAVPYAELENPQSLNLYAYVKNNPLNATDPNGHCTKDGNGHGFLWCLFHYSDQDALHDASNFFHNNDIRDANGNRVNPDKLSDQQLLNVWKEYNDEWRAAIARGENPAAAMAGFFTQWGWRGQADYNKAKDLLNEVNTPQNTVDREELGGKVPTKDEALVMIKDAKGQVTEIEETGHAEGGVTPHTYPHINYTTASGNKGTIKIKP